MQSWLLYTAPSSTGARRTFPVPRYTFTSPSPEAAEPSSVFPDRSTVKLKLPLHAIAMLPSTFNTSSWRVISTSSSFGQGASRQSTPSPTTPRLNSPSFSCNSRRKIGAHHCFVLQSCITCQEQSVIQHDGTIPVF